MNVPHQANLVGNNSFLSHLMKIPFFSTKYSFHDLHLKDLTDVHCHILPGVDDGSPDYEHSIELLSYLESLGYAEVYLTPHTMEDVYNTPSSLKGQFDEFCSKYTGSIKLRLASEYMIDAGFVEKFANGEYLTIGTQKQILVETSYVYPPVNFEGVIADIMKAGLFPVLAHPERYRYMDENFYERLKSKGCKFQLNLNSLSGYYSPNTKKISHKLLSEGFYDYVGTDIHNLSSPYAKYVDAIRLTSKEADELKRLYANNSRI